MKLYGVIGLFLAVISFQICSGQPPSPDTTAEKVVAAWKARFERLERVRYTLSGTVDSKVQVPDELKGQIVIPPGPSVRPLKATVLIDLANRRYRIETTRLAPNRARDRWIPHVSIIASNGKLSQVATPRDRNEVGESEPEMFLAKGNLQHISVDTYLWPPFAAHGIVPTVNFPLRPDRMPVSHEQEEFEVRGTVVHAGRPCTVLRSEPNSSAPGLADEFYIDKERQAAVVRHTYFQGKNPWLRLDIINHETPQGWLPKSWTFTWTVGGKVQRIEKLIVDAFEANPEVIDADFTLPQTSGMIVHSDVYPEQGRGLDPARPAREMYRANSDGNREPIGERTGFTTIEGVQLPPDTGWKWLPWLIGGGVVAVSLVSVLIMRIVRIRRSVRDIRSSALTDP